MRRSKFTFALTVALFSLSINCFAQLKAEVNELSTSPSFAVPVVSLPVELVSFTATQQGDQAFLKWDIANEVNIVYYEVEVAKGNTEFEAAGRVASTDRNGAKASYSFNYEMKPGIKYLFRLKMVDMSGSYVNSYVRTLNSATRGNVNITIAPNPVVSTINMNGMREGSNVITICDATGTRLTTFTTSETEASIDFTNYLPGIYNIVVQDGTGVATTRRVMKQ